MRTSIRRLVPALGALVFAGAMIPSALAQCGMPTKLAKPAAWHPQMGGAHILRTAGYEEEEGRSIVGMWHVIFTAKTSDKNDIPDTVIDDALAVWHPDKTEIMNSMRPPQDGNFCLGVWEQTGRSKYYLNHFPWFANQFPNETNNGIGEPQGPTPSPKPSHWTRVVITFAAHLRWMHTTRRERSLSRLTASSPRHGSRRVQQFPIYCEWKLIWTDWAAMACRPKSRSW